MADWRAQRDQALLVIERERRPSVRADAAEQLCELASVPDRAPELAACVPALLADAQDALRRAGHALAARTLPPSDAAAVLFRGLEDPAARVRVEAAGQLADLALPSSRGALAKALEDTALPVRFEAARGMAALAHPAGLDVLIQALDDDDLRFRSLSCLAQLADRSAVPAIRKLFERWLLAPFDRTQAAGVLMKLGDPSGVPHLLARSRKKSALDRAMAIEILGEVNAEGALGRLTEILSDRSDTARGAAARGLGRLGDRRALPVLQSALAEAGAPDDLRLDVAEGLWRLEGEQARAKLEACASLMASDEARGELSQLLSEGGD